MEENRSITIIVNNVSRQGTTEVRRTLADFLRLDLKLTGTHLGCEHGVCGACTVRVDGRAVRACLMLAVQVDGKHVQTVEGLANDGPLTELQEAFRTRHALQCGFCTPGILMTLAEFIEEVESPTEEDIREALSGNICRCTGYQGIVDAVLDVTRRP